MLQRPSSKKFQRKLLRWYRLNGRDLPWRRTTDPYRIAVSEVMLQQTQVSRVQPVYERWLKKFPTIIALAQAPLPAVLREWSGLGYNRRAKNLRAAAQMVMTQFNGRWPTDPVELEQLPGFGPYTAGAVAIFATSIDHAVVDTNIRRVLTRWVAGTGHLTEKRLLSTAATFVPSKKPNLWHHALMDFGAMICRPKPHCEVCPVRDLCRAYPAILEHRRRRRPPGQRFEKTNRFVRGQVLKYLLQQSASITFAALRDHVQGREITAPRLRAALKELAAEGLITRRRSIISIAA